jgi:hypothetical protein
MQQVGGRKMKVIRRNTKLVGVFLTILMLSITIPYQSVLAEMIETEAILNSTRAQQARDDINILLLREDVQNALMAQGINPIEAKTRIDSLSDSQVIRIADEINKLPAGGYFKAPLWWIVFPIGALILVIIFFVWLANIDWEDTDKK